LGRRLAREIALKALYQAEVGKFPIEESTQLLIEDLALTEDIAEFVRQHTSGVHRHLAEIDSLINQYSIDWPINRLASIERNILRLAVFELAHREDIPASVAINEAVELAKQYGDEASPKFINGVLGNLLRQGLQGGKNEDSRD